MLEYFLKKKRIFSHCFFFQYKIDIKIRSNLLYPGFQIRALLAAARRMQSAICSSPHNQFAGCQAASKDYPTESLYWNFKTEFLST